VRREEFGFIRGKVTFVSDYPATEAALQRVFENGPLVRALAGAGPVTEVHVEMEPDPATPSGFRWSSAKGAPIQLSGGTLIAGEVVTREQPPIALVVPFLREKLGIR
jgi:HlyD family secretion protein